MWKLRFQPDNGRVTGFFMFEPLLSITGNVVAILTVFVVDRVDFASALHLCSQSQRALF